MTFQDFVGHAATTSGATGRAPTSAGRGWARPSPTTGTAPSPGSRPLAGSRFLITQNVDGLHERAGQQRMVALHGRISEVVCLDCGGRTHRTAMQRQLARGQPRLARGARGGDGPARRRRRARGDRRGSSYLRCDGCGGRLKPDVVFFGENVPKQRVERCYAALDDADALLVAGSSLTVMSGLRFVRYAAKAGLPVVIVNRGVDPRRRPRHRQGRGGLQRVAQRVGDAAGSTAQAGVTKMCSAASGTISAVSPELPSSTPSGVETAAIT